MTAPKWLLSYGPVLEGLIDEITCFHHEHFVFKREEETILARSSVIDVDRIKVALPTRMEATWKTVYNGEICGIPLLLHWKGSSSITNQTRHLYLEGPDWDLSCYFYCFYPVEVDMASDEVVAIGQAFGVSGVYYGFNLKGDAERDLTLLKMLYG